MSKEQTLKNNWYHFGIVPNLRMNKEEICASCGKNKIEHQEFGNYDSKALDNPCMKFKKIKSEIGKNK